MKPWPFHLFRAFDWRSSWNINGDVAILKSWPTFWPGDVINDVNTMIPLYRTFNYDRFVRFLVTMKNVLISFIKEYRGPTLRSQDVINDAMTSSPWKYFFGMIWVDHFIFEVKLKLCLIFQIFQNGRHFEVAAFFLPEVIQEIEYSSKIAISISNILSFWSTL